MPTRYSYSAIESYRVCPRQYKFKYIERPDVAKRVTADLYMGNAVHRVLHQLYSAVGYGRVMPLEDALRLYDAEWEKPEKRQITVVKESVTVDDYIATGRKILTRFYEKHHPFDEGTTLIAEQNMSFDLPDSPYRMSAKIDRLWRRPDGVVEICDYKTGDRMPLGPRDHKFFFQMGIYQLAVQEKWPDYTDIELVQYFLKLDEKVSYRMSEEDLDLLKAELKNTIAETLYAERHDSFPTIEGGHCGFCEFYDLCPAKRHRLILDKEEGKEGKAERTTAQSASELAEKYLEVHQQLKELKAEADALKADLASAATDLGVNKLSASSGDVSVKIERAEEFVTKTSDEQGWADFGAVVRQLQLDEYLVPDARAIYKDIYKKGLLPPDDLAKLSAFLVEKERVTIRVKQKQKDDDINDAE